MRCIIFSVGSFVVWLLLASAFLWACWNRVIAKLFQLKAAKFCQALLFLATLAVLLAPCCLLKKMNSGCGSSGMCQLSSSGGCSHSKCCQERCKHECGIMNKDDDDQT